MNLNERSRSRDRSQPAQLSNPEAEKIVLGRILQNEVTFWQINGTLQGFHFSVEIYRDVFTAYHLLTMEGKKPTLSLLQSRVGPEYGDGSSTMTLMTALIRNTAEIDDISDEVTKIIEMWQRRRTIEICDQFIKEAKGAQTDTGYMLADLENCVKDISVNSQAEPVKTMKAAVAKAMAGSKRTRDTGVSPGFDTGIASLDEILGRMFPSDLGVIGAAPGGGKSLLGLQILDRVQEQHGHACFFSLEMRDEDLARRALAGKSSVSASEIEEGNYDAFQYDELRSAQEMLDRSRVLLDDRPGLRIDQIRERCLVLKRTHDLKAIVVDHIRLVQVMGRNLNRFDKAEIVTGTLKTLAKELNLLVIALSQITRSSQRRDDPRPRLSDFDGGSSVEQDADWAIGLFRREDWLLSQKPYDMGTPEGSKWAEDMGRCKGKIEVLNLKRRRGTPKLSCELTFDGRASLLREVER
ncbi:DnaB-like helicase C-terminal domain-containing protein [Rhizobium lusitanum]|nr:DnaB-like helicase C-terminal domain-containing protein [Rhizobium lusitanum]